MKYGLWGSWIEGSRMIILAKTLDFDSYKKDNCSTGTPLEIRASQDLKKFEQEYPNACQRYVVNLGV